MEQVETVQAMQEFIAGHFSEEGFCAETVCMAAGYSRRHAERLFKEYTGKSIQEYIQAVRLTKGAGELLKGGKSVLEIALDSHFRSHEGFTRSFHRRFRLTPSEYRERKIAIPWFTQYPVSHYYAMIRDKEETDMENKENIGNARIPEETKTMEKGEKTEGRTELCTVTVCERPKRKLVYLPSRTAADYMSFCEEAGCDWEGLLNSIPEKFDTAALLELPDFLAEEGFSRIAAGVEVPVDYDKVLPENYRMAELPACIMLYFQGEPYERDGDFGKEIRKVYGAVERYRPERYGLRYAYGSAPSFNFGADTSTGAKVAVPAVWNTGNGKQERDG